MKINGTTKDTQESPLLTPHVTTTSKAQKIASIAHHFKKIMETMGLDLSDPSLSETPQRVAKMYINEVFRGLDASNFPKVSFFENTYGYDNMILVKDITFFSYCEHHFVPFFGKVSVAYYPNKSVIGLSKINRIVQFIASKPQVQEKFTVAVGKVLMELLATQDIAVVAEAKHLCVASRGVNDPNSLTKTSFLSGKFRKKKVQNQFLTALTP
ncbi:GTP cyclohydrolase 1 [Arenibacter antarcticus]|uniref:GTP cyclohydrolase 1 n=1 Tax=Arenibacter antarcticus TaxID=2040469 RepID=A0ABW5VG76_9FLAO|nr:GTP cyclohydrolase I FolE [Arenibacter sp. H213]MCM4167204.1 GTP cyclohydrolase I FolE [Arenibacter sp. H213]